MSHIQRHGLIQKAILIEAELAEILQLTELCNRYENLYMRLSFTMLRNRTANERSDFLYYERDMLVGYLALDSWGVDEKEAIAMVHPDFRRKGIFKELLAAAKEECRQRNISTLLVVCEQSSRAGQACVRAIGAERTFAEHEMHLTNFHERAMFDDRLTMREADLSDIDALATILSSSFNEPESLVTAKLLKRFLQDSQRHIYIATFGDDGLSCKEPVGTLRLDESDESIGIYGFGVIPAYRGRGYGRQMLEGIIRIIRSTSQKPIMLDVDIDNSNAIGLYRSCGFQIKTTYDYYKV